MGRRVVLLVGVVLGIAAPDLLRGSPEPVRDAVASRPEPVAVDIGTAPVPPLTTRAGVRSARRWAARRRGESRSRCSTTDGGCAARRATSGCLRRACRRRCC